MHVLVRLTSFTCHRLCVNLPCNLSALISASTHNEKPQLQSPLHIYIYFFSPPSAPLCLHLLVCAPLPLPASAHTFTFYMCMMSKCLSALQAISHCLTAIRQEANPPSSSFSPTLPRKGSFYQRINFCSAVRSNALLHPLLLLVLSAGSAAIHTCQ